MKLLFFNKFILSILLITSNCFGAKGGSSLYLREFQRYEINKTNTRYSVETNEYYFEKNIVKMLDNSTLIIATELSDETLNININKFIVRGSGLLIQPFGAKVPDIRKELKFAYSEYPAADIGKAGTPLRGNMARTVQDGSNIGSNGGDGVNGLSSVNLKMNLGIAVMDNFLIILRSQSGGKGGPGLKGENGLDAECGHFHGKSGGKGGQGGSGGTGGYPGSIGDISIKWRNLGTIISSDEDVPLGLSIYRMPGLSGFPGNSGAGGDGGQGIDCGSGRRDYSGGSVGKSGKIGNFLFGHTEIFKGSKGAIEFERLLDD